MPTAAEKANHLLKLAANPAAREGGSHESTAALRALASLIETHELLVVEKDDSGNPVQQPAMVEQVYVHGIDPEELAAEILGTIPTRSRSVPTGVESITSELAIALCKAIDGPANKRPARVKRAFSRLARDLTEGLKPSVLHDRQDLLWGELRALFQREAEQPGADQIAAKLGRRAQDVRAELQRAVRSGWLEVVGTTRDPTVPASVTDAVRAELERAPRG
jgi:hypothetical protein